MEAEPPSPAKAGAPVPTQ